MRIGCLLLSWLVFSTLLAACGGNEDSGPPVTGVLFDSAVEGVDYVCSGGRQGTTNAAGEFTCGEGDSVAFSVGNIDLGAAPAAARVTVFDLTGAAQPDNRQLQEYVGNRFAPYNDLVAVIANGDAPLHRALNIALLLQTLDEDKDPENGIEITADSRARLAAVTYSLNFARSRVEFIRRLRKVLTQAGIPRSPRQPLAVVRHLVKSGVIAVPIQQPMRYDFDALPYVYAFSVAFTFDTNGDLREAVREDSGSGGPKYYWDFTCDVQGNLSRTETIVDQGPVINLQTFTYDGDGNLTRYELDSRADGLIDAVNVYTYDLNGNLTQIEKDSDGDGVSDEIEVTTFDANGNQLKVEGDQDGDGVIDWTETSAYDNDGNLIHFGYDNNADGVIDFEESYSYDAGGNLLRSEVDSDADGSIDVVLRWTYDADGNLMGFTTDAGADGTIDQTETYTYDTMGRLTQWERIGAWDGDRNMTIVYDASGGMTRRAEWISNSLPSVDLVDMQIYDATGNLVRFETTYNDELYNAYTASFEQASSFPQWDYSINSTPQP